MYKLKSIGGRLCYFENNRVICWCSDMLHITKQLIEDKYQIVNWRTFDDEFIQLHYGIDFNCIIAVDTVEEIEIRDVESLRWYYIRQAPII